MKSSPVVALIARSALLSAVVVWVCWRLRPSSRMRLYALLRRGMTE